MTRRGKSAERGLGFRAEGRVAQAGETARQSEQRAELGAAGEEMQGIVPSRRRARNASAVLKNFVRQAKKIFSTLSAHSGR
jgi:hypothetical protein